MMARVLEHLADLVNADAALVRRGRHCSVTFLPVLDEIRARP
jgi:hypothetical protein